MVKIKKSQIKELIRQSLIELDAEKAKKMGLKSKGFGNYEDEKGQHYTTKGGKLHKVDAPDKDDVGGPAHPNVPKKKPSKPKITKIKADPFGGDKKPTYTHKGGDKLKSLKVRHPEKPSDDDTEKQTMKASTDANKKMEIDVLNKQADKGDGALIDTEYGTVVWSNGDPDEDSFIATNEDGEEIEVDYSDIVRFHNDDDSIMKNLFGKSDDGSKQTKVMKQNDATAEKINPNLSNSKDLVMRGMADDIDEFMNEIPDEGQDFDKADELLNLVRDNEQGMRDDDDDMIDDYKKGILKVLNTPGKSKNESIKESKGRRCTVKEVQKWMKGLEENRYKKTYNSDCRRVSWMVNNEGVELTEMPTSMRKKWSKAEYGRERHLAKEFTKHLNSNQLQEQKLRKVIRKIIKEQINEAYRSQSIFFDKKDKSKLEKLLKKNKGKFPFNPSGESVVNWSLNDRGSKGLEWGGIPKAKYNKAVEFFMKNKLNPRG